MDKKVPAVPVSYINTAEYIEQKRVIAVTLKTSKMHYRTYLKSIHRRGRRRRRSDSEQQAAVATDNINNNCKRYTTYDRRLWAPGKKVATLGTLLTPTRCGIAISPARRRPTSLPDRRHPTGQGAKRSSPTNLPRRGTQHQRLQQKCQSIYSLRGYNGTASKCET